MKENRPGFVPLLFGGDINVYSVARAFHQAYGVRSTVWGKYPTGPCYRSAIIDYHVCEKNDDPDNFITHVREFAQAHLQEKVILLGCGDSYVDLCAHFLGQYPENVVAPYINGELMSTLIHKQRFYEMCDKYGIDYPTTFIYHREMGNDFTLPFDPPYICKPANSVMYWEYPFPTQKKVYKLDTREELEQTLKEIYDAGYHDTMILQDFLPGDDTYMRVLTNYSDRHGKVKLMALGHVLLEEHTPHGIGNHAVIINEVNEALCEKIKAFLEDIGFVGFSNFDIKFDQRDGKFKVFEINVRQGRSNYYVTGSGNNIAQYVVRDRILQQDLPFHIAREEYLWSVVPRSVMFGYIHPKQYKEQMRRLIREGRVSNSLDYDKDRSLRRRLTLLKGQLGHVYKYRKYVGGKD
ncbi:MAG: ATP-grasp domain-containing protein [Eubacteriales bacterium]|jgi:D-aspartate ligase